MKIIKLFLLLPVLLLLNGCDVLTQVGGLPGINPLPPSEAEVTSGLKSALEVGITNAVKQTSENGGFLNNSLIRIPFPPEAARMERTLRDIGLGAQVDQFVRTMNAAAEEASKKATPIFVNAIRQMSFTDVMNIWRGDSTAATQYLKRTTSDQLRQAFTPVIKEAIEKVELTALWNPLASAYNSIPFVTPVNPNLENFITDRALEGLFAMVAREEAAIRRDPAARVNDILKRVFGWLDNERKQ
ncbi:hypothetical protein JCM31826_11870 [Thermaurantimonas aggregans]|uniref:DUF4197 domain-containing protein n=1 Tax=Thermaurantimonas aggregans TaxID=2173829 RepID=A0A401XKY9_9FLAO|nr:DUF4197 domain-containing protein [Thermaurantimonas aggregans]MCX8148279.1 DUF4197 domain-containing protein [Thermaurantimonas aggregans]GCD77705.1 hypothetical protein JCM31826_11870 [Thermaurantimonas aggregans]